MVYGVTVFHSRDLGLGEFAAADHAGSSIRSLKRSINSLQSMKGIKIRVGHGQSIIHPGHPWEVVDDLKKGIDDLKMDEWGLDYDDFKPPSTKDRQTGLPEMKEGIFSFRC
jgi:hypothetical protein